MPAAVEASDQTGEQTGGAQHEPGPRDGHVNLNMTQTVPVVNTPREASGPVYGEACASAEGGDTLEGMTALDARDTQAETAAMTGSDVYVHGLGDDEAASGAGSEVTGDRVIAESEITVRQKRGERAAGRDEMPRDEQTGGNGQIRSAVTERNITQTLSESNPGPVADPDHARDASSPHGALDVNGCQPQHRCVSVAGTTGGGEGEVTQTITQVAAEAVETGNYTALVTTRSRAARHETDEDDAADSAGETDAPGDRDKTRRETRDVKVLSDGPNKDRTVTQDVRYTQADESQIGDAVKDFGNIDVTDLETLTETITEPETETSREFKRAQDADKGLDSYRTRALAGSSEYRIIDGLLYKRASPDASAINGGYVLVLPNCYERETIRLAHSSLLGGHLGFRKSVQRIANVFFFPHLKQKVTQYVNCCREVAINSGNQD